MDEQLIKEAIGEAFKTHASQYFIADDNNTQGLNPADLLTIFPQTDMAKEGYSVVEVAQVAQPAYNPITQDCTEGTPIPVSGIWTQTWVVTTATAAESGGNPTWPATRLLSHDCI